jgi:hypothetical protein
MGQRLKFLELFRSAIGRCGVANFILTWSMVTPVGPELRFTEEAQLELRAAEEGPTAIKAGSAGRDTAGKVFPQGVVMRH